jgi:uncharacterized protein
MPTLNAPAAFHLLAKPTGAMCNLECKYCFFLPKAALYPGSHFRMTDALLESYMRQYIESQRVPEVSIAWQGGEPTLMGLDFFRRSIVYQKKHQKPNTTIQNALQTNGVLLDDAWCEFFRQHNFLIGLSLDGPRKLHDAYRVDKGGQPTFDRVMRGLRYLQKHRVEFNILATVHAANADHPLEVYRFLRDEAGVEFMQFIPIVERHHELGSRQTSAVTRRSVRAEQYGRFMSTIFDHWVRRDVGSVYVQLFDVTLAAWAGTPPSLCLFSPTCGNALALEHNGDLYACDHFVEPGYFLGNITDSPMDTLVASDKQRQFGLDKRGTLPRTCRECEVRFVCHGGCPKDRFIDTPDGEAGLNYLCRGYKAFFNHVDQPMRIMVALLRQNRTPAEIVQILAAEEARQNVAFASSGWHDPCPCGSGRKFGRCHGRTARK